MKKIKNIILGIFAAGMLTLAAPVGGICAYASSAKISFSDPSATVGQEFSVNVKISSQDGNLGASDVVLSYDPSVIEFVSGNNASGGAGSVRLVGTMDSSSTKAFSYTLKFKAVQAGNTSISVGSYEVYDADAQAVTVSKPGAASVKVKAPASSSAEAALSALKISPGKLSPAFSPDVTSYTAQVGASVDKLAVSASAKDSKAKVLVSGDSGLKVGANTVICKVTAEDGQTTKNYTITVNKLDMVDVPSEAEEAAETEAEAAETASIVTDGLNVEIDGTAYTVATEFDASLLPEGYAQSECTYGGSQVQCGSGNDLTLLYLQDAEGNGAFYIYMPDSGALSPYVTIDVTAKSILVLPPDASVQIPDGFVETTIQLNGSYKVQGWVWKSDEQQQYCVIYGMNESGEKSLYRYDIAEKTFQRYFEDPSLATKYDDAQVEEIVDKYNALCQSYNLRFIIIAVLGVACMILFFIVINLLLKRKEWKAEAQAAGRQSAKRRVQPSDHARTERRRTASERGKEEEKTVRRVREAEDSRTDRIRQEEERENVQTRREREERTSSEARTKRMTEEKRRGETGERTAPAKRRPQEARASYRTERRAADEDRINRERRAAGEEDVDREYREDRENRADRERRAVREERVDREYRENRENRADRERRAVREDRADRGSRTERTSAPARRAAREAAASDTRRTERPTIQVRPARSRSELYYTLEQEDNDRPTRYESEFRTTSQRRNPEVRRERSEQLRRYEDERETERSRRAREAKARLERARRDEDGFEYTDDPE